MAKRAADNWRIEPGLSREVDPSLADWTEQVRADIAAQRKDLHKKRKAVARARVAMGHNRYH